MSGYSKTPLYKKLGLKPEMKMVFVNAPKGYIESLENTSVAGKNDLDFIQFFVLSKKELSKEFPKLKILLAKSGMLWISWPKKSSKMRSDLDENIVMNIGLENGLVDIKVAAIDETWSGLKFVYRVKDR